MPSTVKEKEVVWISLPFTVFKSILAWLKVLTKSTVELNSIPLIDWVDVVVVEVVVVEYAVVEDVVVEGVVVDVVVDGVDVVLVVEGVEVLAVVDVVVGDVVKDAVVVELDGIEEDVDWVIVDVDVEVVPMGVCISKKTPAIAAIIMITKMAITVVEIQASFYF